MRARGSRLTLLFLALVCACVDGRDRPPETPPQDLISVDEMPVQAATATDPPLTLTLDVVERFADAHRSLREDGVSTADLESPADAVEIPQGVRRTIEDAGLSVDDFLIIDSSLLPAYLVARLREAGLPASKRPAGVREAHIAFAQRYLDEIEELLGLEPSS